MIQESIFGTPFGPKNDCDDIVDDGLDRTVQYQDLDRDGYGMAETSTETCVGMDGYVANADDCDDTDSSINPSAEEVCDEQDNDCDDETDEDVGVLSYPDSDMDGYGDAVEPAIGCNLLDGAVSIGLDCDDTDADINPGQGETCGDSVDNNCNGAIDEDIDQDGDGHTSCGGDCNDAYASVNPGQVEFCDGLDNDCDGEVDPGYDLDGDGVASCLGDCDDSDQTIYPEAEELCNQVDDNCDGQIDEGLATTQYPDGDGDGFGDPSGEPQADCVQLEGYAENPSDCDDGDAQTFPGASEICDGNDNDCNSLVDDSLFSGSGLVGECGIQLILPTTGAMAVPDGFKITIDFDSDGTQENDHPTYASPDIDHLWLQVQGSDGSNQRSDSEVLDLGSPVGDQDIPTRITWSVGMSIVPDTQYTLTVTQCENLCVDRGDGWVIKGMSTFHSSGPCGTAANIKADMQIQKLGDTSVAVIDGMNWDIENSEQELGLFLLDLVDEIELPMTGLSLGIGPLDYQSSYAISAEWGVPSYVALANIDREGKLVSQEQERGLVIPMTAGIFVMFIQEAVIAATVTVSNGMVRAMPDHRLTGFIHRDDMHQLLLDAGLEVFEVQIVYDVDGDRDGENELASFVVTSYPISLDSVEGMIDNCRE